MVRRYGGEAAGTAEDDSSVGYDPFYIMKHAHTYCVSMEKIEVPDPLV